RLAQGQQRGRRIRSRGARSDRRHAMSAEVHAVAGHADAHPAGHHHHEPGWFEKYFWSTDHKMIGMQYLFTGMAMALIGGFTVYVFRMQLAFPNTSIPGYGRVTAT